MAAAKLTDGERERLLTMLAEGVPQAKIAEEFRCSVQNVQYHERGNRERIQTIARDRGDLALLTGLAFRGNRKAKLERLAVALEDRLGGDEFTQAHGRSVPIVREYRETLRQIRDEMKDLEPQTLNVSATVTEVVRRIVEPGN